MSEKIMADQLKILGIAGSLRKASYNRGALRAAQQLCPEGARIEVFSVPFEEAVAMIGDGRITDAKTSVGLLMVKLLLSS